MNQLDLFILGELCLDMRFSHSYSKKAGYLILIFLLFVVIRKITYPAKSLPSNKANITISNPISSYFKQQLTDERLSSYSKIYNDSYPVCNMTGSLTENQQRAFHTMSELLMKFQK